MRSRLYVGDVMHARRAPVEHAFRYPAYVFAFDLDELDELDCRCTLFGHNRKRLFALYDDDYLGERGRTLRDKVQDKLAAAGIDLRPERIELVTTARVMNHSFNPVSFYYCYGAEGSWPYVVTEVNNTFGEGHTYVLDAGAARPGAGDSRVLRERKRFHVSPFNDMDGDYEFRLAPLNERLDLRIDLHRGNSRWFTSRLTGSARKLDNRALWRLAATYPATAALTVPRIMWQAFRLHYGKRLPVFRKPDPSSRATFESTNPPYVHEFSAPTWLQRRSEDSADVRHDHGD